MVYEGGRGVEKVQKTVYMVYEQPLMITQSSRMYVSIRMEMLVSGKIIAMFQSSVVVVLILLM